MGNGYTRNDTADNIADGNIINASDLDGEFDAVQVAFDNSTGHTHDGTDGEGAPIDKVGPAQDIVVTTTVLRPKTNNTVDLGVETTNEFKDLYIDGTAYLDSVDIDGGSVTGLAELTVDNLSLDGNTITTTDTNGNLNLRANGTGVISVDATDVNFGDSDKATFGDGSDLQIYHNGSVSLIEDSGTGGLTLRSDLFTVQNAAGTETVAQFVEDSFVKLYHDNSEVFATTATGIDVTGTVTADGLTVDGDVEVSAALPRLILNETDTTDLNTAIRNNAGVMEVQTVDDAATSFTKRIDLDHATGDISFYEDTGTTPKFFWDSSAESLGIGTVSPSKALEVTGSSGELLRLSVTADGGTQQSFGIGFATGDTNTHPAALIEAEEFDASDSRANLVFSTRGTDGDVAPTEAMRIDSAGHAIIPAGVTLGTAAGVYAADNTLDDYETGFFEPTFTSTGTNPSGITYDPTVGNEGHYTKIGKVVHIQINIRTDAISNKGSGNLQVSGLPFVSSDYASQGGVATFPCYSAGFLNKHPSYALVAEAETTLSLVYRATSDGSVENVLTSALNTGSNDNLCRITGTYMTEE